MTIIKSQLKQILKQKEITAYQLAKDLDITQQVVYQWVNPRYKINPNLKNSLKVCVYLGCTMAELYPTDIIIPHITSQINHSDLANNTDIADIKINNLCNEDELYSQR